MHIKVLELILRGAASFVILLILGRFVGRKMISRITFFDFIIGVTLGSLGIRLALGMDNSFIDNCISGIVIVIMVIITDVFNLKSHIFRMLEEGEPIVLINQGKILNKNMSKARISMSKLLMLLREKNMFNIDEVEFAILETDGHLSVLLYSNMQTPKITDLNLYKNEISLPVDLIVDGKIIYNSLKKSGKNEGWLGEQLKRLNIGSEKDVFYACLNSTNKLFISLKN